jgi:hypothetical protein
MPWRRSKYRQVRYGRPDRENPFLPRRRRLQNHNSLAAHRENGIADVGCHRASDLGRGLQLHAKSNSVLPLPRRQRRPQFESPRAGLGLPYSQSSSGAFGAFGGNVGGFRRLDRSCAIARMVRPHTILSCRQFGNTVFHDHI